MTLALALALPAAASAQSDEARAASRADARAAQEAAEAGRLAEAEATFRRALEVWPENAVALNNLAWLLLTAPDEGFRRPGEALPLAERAVALEPRRAAFVDTLALARHTAGRSLEAARLSLRATRLDPQEGALADALVRFARAAAEDAAVADERAEALALLGEGQARRGRRDEALTSFAAALDLQPWQSLALAGRARLLVAAGRAEAAAALEAALAHPDLVGDAALHRDLGRLLRASGDTAAAAAALEEAATLAGGDFDLRLEAARAWRAAGDADGVARVVSAAAAALRRHPPLWPTQWAPRFHALEAEAWDARARGAAAPEATQAARRRALAARVRALAVRATHGRDGEVLAEARALDGALRGLAAAAVRAHLVEQVLRQRDLPRLIDVTAQALPPGARGRRIAWGDVDGDGDPDLLADGRRLFVNEGGRFVAAGPEAGLGGLRTVGGVFGDMDRDGDLDLYAFGHGAGTDRLLRNDSGAAGVRFTDVTEALGAGAPSDDFRSEAAAWADLDGDGRLDLYVANYERAGRPLARGTPDRLWIRTEAGFRDASPALPPECGRGVSAADFDQDGDLDVLVANYRLDRDLLLVNYGGGDLREEGAARGVAGQEVRGAFGHTIGAAWGDLDLDGDLDLVSSRLAHPRFADFSEPTRVYLQAEGRFAEVRAAAGIAFEETHADPTLFDVDGDGDLDLFLTSVYAGRPSFLWRNRRVEGLGAALAAGAAEPPPLAFDDVTWAAGARLFDGWGAAAADFDGDGDLDLCVSAGGKLRLLRNDTSALTGARSVRLRLPGWAAGATCVLTDAAGLRLVRQLSLGHGAGNQNEPVVHFGVGRASGPFAAEIRWPGGGRTRLTGLRPSQGITVVEEVP